MSIRLFSTMDVSEFIAGRYSIIKREIEAFSDEKIISCNLEEWADYYAEAYKIEPITIYKECIKNSIEEKKVDVYNRLSRMNPYEPEYYNVDGYNIDYLIPFYGNSRLLQLRPSAVIYQDYTVEDIAEPTENQCGIITLRLVFIASELKSKGDSASAFVENQFNSKFLNIEKMISNVNYSFNSYNTNLRKYTMELLEKRKHKAEDFSTISKALQIPMKLSKDAPNIRPIKLERVERKPISQPKNRPQEPEYYISDNDYENILNIIHTQCSAMESAPVGFSSLEEEKLRDIIISTLETHYENSVTGETFRKNGKTDIQVKFENKAAFIAECKIWHGIKKFEDAISQLFGYTTWKDTKVALVLFNKSNKNFKSILNSVDAWTKTNCKTITRKNGNMWNCVYYRADTQTDIKLAIAVYDISH